MNIDTDTNKTKVTNPALDSKPCLIVTELGRGITKRGMDGRSSRVRDEVSCRQVVELKFPLYPSDFPLLGMIFAPPPSGHTF